MRGYPKIYLDYYNRRHTTDDWNAARREAQSSEFSSEENTKAESRLEIFPKMNRSTGHHP
jgi:hypothetical protein